MIRPDRSSPRYTLVAVFLHWVMAVGIAMPAIIGLVMVHVELAPMRLFQIYQLHKSIGVTILLATVLRLVWRLIHRPPPLPDSMPPLERTAAAAGHLALYFFLFALPMTGWALVSASVFSLPTVLYGVIPWPHLPVLPSLPDKVPVEDLLKQVHAYGAYALIALIVLHAAAALRHHFILKDDVLTRMLPKLPGSRRRSTSAQTEGPSS